MSDKIVLQIKERLSDKTTDELIAIWKKNDRSEWSNEAFIAIHELLLTRGVTIPEQSPSDLSTTAKGSRGQMILYFIGAVFFAGWLIVKWDSLAHQEMVLRIAPNFHLFGVRTFLAILTILFIYRGIRESQRL